MNLKTYYNLQSTQAIFFIKHTSSLGREEASSSFNNLPLFDGDKFPLLCTALKKDHDQNCTELYTKKTGVKAEQTDLEMIYLQI